MVCHNLSENVLSRVYPFAKKISEEHNVIVAGYVTKEKGIYSPYKDLMNFFSIRTISDIKKLIKIEIDLIHCFKAATTSYLPSLMLKYFKKIPIVLDLDDIDFYPTSFSRYLTPKAFSNYLHPLADAKTVHSSILQEIYGGEIIRTGTNTEIFKPNIISSEKLKKDLRLENSFLIIFTGSPRNYKGVDIIIKAINKLNKPDIKFLLVGPTDDPDFQVIYRKYKKIINVHNPVSYVELPKFLDISDCIILPQKNYGLWCRAQIPTKLYDAMAMAKPVIVSNVGDLPDIVSDAGIILNEKFDKRYPTDEEINRCADAIEWIYNNPRIAKRMGKRARKICIKNYNWDILKRKTLKIYRSIL